MPIDGRFTFSAVQAKIPKNDARLMEEEHAEWDGKGLELHLLKAYIPRRVIRFRQVNPLYGINEQPRY